MYNWIFYFQKKDNSGHRLIIISVVTILGVIRISFVAVVFRKGLKKHKQGVNVTNLPPPLNLHLDAVQRAAPFDLNIWVKNDVWCALRNCFFRYKLKIIVIKEKLKSSFTMHSSEQVIVYLLDFKINNLPYLRCL